jgi:hypothetical protein
MTINYNRRVNLMSMSLASGTGMIISFAMALNNTVALDELT